jgi:uncharacterized protein
MRDDDFEWDDAKAASNLDKHGISFVAAQRVFDDDNASADDDFDSSADEDRFLITGIVGALMVTVSYTMRGNRVRIVSARPATNRERDGYYRL